MEEGLETEAATGARVGQAEQETRAGQERTLWAHGTEQALERLCGLPERNGLWSGLRGLP